MSEILFIANDPSALALIETLQSLVEPRICLESDYTSGIKRIFDRHPAVVFLQNRIGDVTCDKLANQVKMLLDGAAVPLVLLSDEAVMPYGGVSTYEACFDIFLPAAELSWQVQQLLHTLPNIVWRASAAPQIVGEETYDLSETMEITLPTGDADFPTPLSWLVDEAGSAGCEGAPPPHFSGILKALEGNPLATAELTIASELEEPQFPADFLADPFSTEPLLIFEETPQPEQPSIPAPAPKPAAAQHESLSDFRRIEKADPTQLFGSMSERAAPSFTSHRHNEPNPARTGASPATRSAASYPEKTKAADSPAGSMRKPLGPATETTQAGPPADDILPRYVASTLGLKGKNSRSYRALITCTILALGIASLVFFTRKNLAGTPEASQGIGELDGKLNASRQPLSAPPAAQQLPLFIPQVAPDAGYPASHPGWERYQADALEYLVYREQVRVRAVQVLSEARGAITVPLLKTCIRLSSGHEQFDTKKSEALNGFQVVTGALRNGGELVVYKEVPGGEIRGFVLSFPVDGPATPESPKVTAR